jgi:hypothetical protein
MKSARDILRNVLGNEIATAVKASQKTDQEIIAEADAILRQKRSPSTKPARAVIISSQQQQLVDAGDEIRRRWPGPSDLSFMAKHLVQVTLPHSDPGDVTLVIGRTGVG